MDGVTRDSAELADAVVTPGEEIVRGAGFLRGRGTYAAGGDALLSNVAGVVRRVNRLVSVAPIGQRYFGAVGDVVVGRVLEVSAKRWRIDINARQDGILALTSMHLAGGEQRRRTADDQLHMRTWLAEGDLLVADVHSLHADGAAVLHARSLRYGKLENGQLQRVPPALVARCPSHLVALPCGVDLVLGMNGWIWLSESLGADAAHGGDDDAAAAAAAAAAALPAWLHEQAEAGVAAAVEARKRAAALRVRASASSCPFAPLSHLARALPLPPQPVGVAARHRLARVANSIHALRVAARGVTPTSIMAVYDASLALALAPAALLAPPLAAAVVAEALGAEA
jgi:exosome complex component RRP4